MNQKSILSALKSRDILLHYPYQSFQYTVDLLREAAIDPKVKSISMTLYRVAKNSNVINALINAIRNGKTVNVPSFQVSEEDQIEVREKASKQVRVQNAVALAEQYGFADWIEVDTNAL